MKWKLLAGLALSAIATIAVSATVSADASFDAATGTLTYYGTVESLNTEAIKAVKSKGALTTDIISIKCAENSVFPRYCNGVNACRSIYSTGDYNNLMYVDFRGADTSNVIRMDDMFYGCHLLRSVNMSGLDLHNVQNMSSMFSGNSALTTVEFKDTKTLAVTDMKGMFYGCKKLTSIDLSSFETPILQTF